MAIHTVSKFAYDDFYHALDFLLRLAFLALAAFMAGPDRCLRERARGLHTEHNHRLEG